MHIAIIGWGSLIWSPGCLWMESRWHVDGPMLPVEFVRISYDGRATLAIHHPSPRQRTYWAKSAHDDLELARVNLMEREGGLRLDVAPFLAQDGSHCAGVAPETLELVKAWLQERPQIDAVIWTGYFSNWRRKRGVAWSVEEVVSYCQSLQADPERHQVALRRAREYLCNTPPQIRTPARQAVEAALGWEPYPLAPALFEEA